MHFFFIIEQPVLTKYKYTTPKTTYRTFRKIPNSSMWLLYVQWKEDVNIRNSVLKNFPLYSVTRQARVYPFDFIIAKHIHELSFGFNVMFLKIVCVPFFYIYLFTKHLLEAYFELLLLTANFISVDYLSYYLRILFFIIIIFIKETYSHVFVRLNFVRYFWTLFLELHYFPFGSFIVHLLQTIHFNF